MTNLGEYLSNSSFEFSAGPQFSDLAASPFLWEAGDYLRSDRQSVLYNADAATFVAGVPEGDGDSSVLAALPETAGSTGKVPAMPEPLVTSVWDGQAPEAIRVILGAESAQNSASFPVFVAAPPAFRDETSPFELIEHHHSCACAGCSGLRVEPTEAAATDGGTSGSTTAAAGVLQDMADFLLTGYWNTGYGDGTRSHNVTGSGTDANNGVLHYNLSGYSADADGLTADRATLVREAFKLYESTLGIQFVETTSTDNNLVDFFFRDNDSGAYASHSYYNSGVWGSAIHYAQINVAQSWSGGTSTYDDYTLQTILHEIGHAIGLGHQGPYNGSATYGVDSQFDNDSWQASMMSYFSQTGNTYVDASFEYLQTPMTVDWLALDEIYGRQGFGVSNAYTEDTTWGFNTTITSAVSDIWASWSSWANRTASTIVDSGGIDTLDLSGYSNNTVINVAPSDPGSTQPSTSDIGGRIGNLTIAVGTIIENVIGGAGGEEFYGNAADNIMTGNGGDDTFFNSQGNDTYLGGDGTDYLMLSGAFVDYSFVIAGEFLQVIEASIDLVESTVEWLTFSSNDTRSWQSIADMSLGNTAPVAVDDAYAVTEDVTLSAGGLLVNDTDADLDPLTVGSVEGVQVGTGGVTVSLASGASVTVFQDGSFVYAQNGVFDSLGVDQQATDSFTYTATDGLTQSTPATVTITIDGVFDNTAPVALDDAATIAENGIASIAVLGNDSDFDGGPLSVIEINGAAAQVDVTVTLQSGAAVTLRSGGVFDYDPGGAFDGLESGQTDSDSFTYTVSDGQGGVDTATVAITIDGVSPPVSAENVVIDFDLEAPGGYSGDYGLSFAGLDVVANTSISGDRAGAAGSDGTFTISAGGNDFDLNSLSMISQSGRQKVQVQAFDDGAPVGSVQINASARRPTDATFDATFDSVDEIVFTGSANYFVDDIALTTYTPIDPNANLAPVTVNDALTTGEGSAVSGNVLANDSDPNGDPLALVSLEGSATGAVTLASGAVVAFGADGAIVYDPNGAFDGLYDGQEASDSFVYTVSDGRGGETEGAVNVTILGAGVPPASTTIGFEDASDSGTGVVTEDVFIFSDAVLTSANPGVASGSSAIASLGASITISQSGGGTFDFDAGVFTIEGRGKKELVLDGFLDGQLVGSETFQIRTGRETALNPQDAVFDQIDEVVVSSVDGVILDDLVFLA